MLSKKTKLTNRKFYNKWLYKVTLICEGCSLFRSKSLEEIKEFCLGDDPAEHRFSLWTRAYNNKQDILDICNILDVQDKNSYKLRIERNNIDFYTNDPTFYKDLSEKLKLQGISTGNVYPSPISSQKPAQNCELVCKNKNNVISSQIAPRIINLPLFPYITEQEISVVLNNLHNNF